MIIQFVRAFLNLRFLIISMAAATYAQWHVDTNIFYGMYSGTALLLDIHYPAKPNGFGIVFIPGSGWAALMSYSASALKESPPIEMYVPSLNEAGYTVFAVNHRAALWRKEPRLQGLKKHSYQRQHGENLVKTKSVHRPVLKDLFPVYPVSHNILWQRTRWKSTRSWLSPPGRWVPAGAFFNTINFSF